jgi:tetratricopeptide (TPR) repeat protein
MGRPSSSELLSPSSRCADNPTLAVDRHLRAFPYARDCYARGYAWTQKKEYDKAIADITEVIQLDPKNADAFLARGKLRIAKKDYSKAIADYTVNNRLQNR